MRVLCVQPGPDWSVMDVHRGWVRAFRELGCQVQDFDYNRQLSFYGLAHFEQDDGTYRPAIPGRSDQAIAASKGIESALYEWWPDMLWVTYGPMVDPNVLRLARHRGHIVVLCHTESPYEDDRQLGWVRQGVADVHFVNDPTNLDRYRELEPHTYYLPHSYDPNVHRPPSKSVPMAHDMCFVGSMFPSRLDWLTRFHEAAPDIDLHLAGNWRRTIDDDHPLRRFCADGNDLCIDNADVPPLYWASRAGLNLYRRESERPELERGWSMGPREVEMAACGLFHLTEARGENREILPMLPTFETPEDAAEQARWWIGHHHERDRVAAEARAAVADWTFVARARQVLELIEKLAAG